MEMVLRPPRSINSCLWTPRPALSLTYFIHLKKNFFLYYHFFLYTGGTGSAQISPKTQADQNQLGLNCAGTCSGGKLTCSSSLSQRLGKVHYIVT